MKKKMLCSALICVLFVCGCGKGKTAEEKVMEEYAKDYYKNYMQDYVIGTNSVEITIEMLENAKKNADADYDLDKLKDCKSTSKVTFNLKGDKNEIASTTFDLDCE